jgi:hydrogenase-4 component E
VVKAGVIPALLETRARRMSGEVRSYVNLPTGALICGALVVVAFSQTRELFGSRSDILAACLPISVAVTLIGLFVMVTRRQALMQVVGLVLLENAIFLAAVSLTYGMPLVVEAGVLMDLMAGVALLGLFVQRLEDALGDGDTTSLTGLKG